MTAITYKVKEGAFKHLTEGHGEKEVFGYIVNSSIGVYKDGASWILVHLGTGIQILSKLLYKKKSTAVAVASAIMELTDWGKKDMLGLCTVYAQWHKMQSVTKNMEFNSGHAPLDRAGAAFRREIEVAHFKIIEAEEKEESSNQQEQVIQEEPAAPAVRVRKPVLETV
jgi:hypothetical protein